MDFNSDIPILSQEYHILVLEECICFCFRIHLNNYLTLGVSLLLERLNTLVNYYPSVFCTTCSTLLGSPIIEQ